MRVCADDKSGFITTLFENCLNGLKADPRVASLNCTQHLTDAKALITNMQTYCDSVANWTRPIHINQEMAKFNEMDSALALSRVGIDRFQSVLAEFANQKAAAIAAQDQRFADDRNKVSAMFRKHEVPAALAKACADYLMTSSSESVAPPMQLSKEDLLQLSSLSSPHFIPHDEKSWIEGGTVFHQSCREWFEAHKAEFDAQYNSKREALLTKDLLRGHRAVDTNPKLATFKWHDEAAAPLLDDCVQVKVQLHVIKELCFDCRLEVWPWAMQRAIIQQFHGSSVVVVLPLEIAAKHPDLSSWLNEAHHASLSGFFCAEIDGGRRLVLAVG